MEDRATEIIKDIELYGAHNYAPLQVVLVEGDGVFVKDINGKYYIDMMACYSAINAGHRNQRIISVATSQLLKLANCSRAYYNEPLSQLAKLLCQICKMDVMLPMNSGAEAVETAIKIVRKWGHKIKGVEKDKAEIIVCSGNFHGRTITVVGFSSEEQYRDGFGPFAPGFVSIPFGNIRALKKAINKNTVAFLVEPIQGEAGIIVPPKGFLKKAYGVCKKNNVVFVADEIQTGLGRTGKIFACEHENVQPDMYILGKALGGGIMPISAVAGYWGVMDVIKPGDHGSTFGGNPLACAIAVEYLKLMQEEDFPGRAKQLGDYFIRQLREIKSPHVKEVRGKGLLVGVELKKEAGGARRFCEALMEEGVLTKETHEHVIRFAPPLIIKKDEVDLALEKIEKVLTQI
ncbi:ornithine--oxo-acid transaminase [Patescibacteria group bacterium]|nr:ornithine--oxo-acid transaminase [Patescibacteria group bacterium]